MDDQQNVVKQTSDYDQFRFMDNNREQSNGHIEALKAAFSEMGNLTRVQPILVNENFEIIDGQHRFQACKELGEPIFYTQVSGLGIQDARKMNILHRSWVMEDYARSYANSGDASYKRLLKLQEDYGFSLSLTLLYSTGHEEHGLFKKFRNGEFVLSPDDNRKAQFRLDLLSDVSEKFSLAATRNFAVALLRAEQTEGFDHNRLMDKLKRYGSSMVTRQAGVTEYLRMIEEIYNHNQSESRRLRLF